MLIADAVKLSLRSGPCYGIKAIDGYFSANLVGIVHIPSGLFQGGIYKFFSGFCFIWVGQCRYSLSALVHHMRNYRIEWSIFGGGVWRHVLLPSLTTLVVRLSLYLFG